MFIRSERLFLRPAWPEDQDVVLHELSQHIPSAARSLFPASFLAGLESGGAAFANDPHLPQFLIALPDRNYGALVGFAGLIQGETGIDLACWIVREQRGKGYGTECLSALTQIARMLGCDAVGAEHSLEDPAFGRVLRKIGFCPTGQIKLRQSHGAGADIPVARYHCELIRPENASDRQIGPNKAVATSKPVAMQAA